MLPINDLLPVAIQDGKATVSSQIDWRAAIQPIMLIIAAPTAFIIWTFRDHIARQNLENQRKDINLKEFQEIQMRAAGAMDEKLPAKARETLQIAAIHQLRPFLRGEYGASFRRPAWELLKASLATSAADDGYLKISNWVNAGGFKEKDDGATAGLAIRNAMELFSKIRSIRPGPLSMAQRAVINEEKSRIFRPDLPLSGGHFDTAKLKEALLSGLDLQNTSFIGAVLEDAHLESADLSFARLEGANLEGAHLEGANLSFAHLEGANLEGAHLEGANLSVGYFESADLSDCHINDQTKLKDEDWGPATYNDATVFSSDWKTLSKDEKAEARKPWRESGMVHINEKKKKR